MPQRAGERERVIHVEIARQISYAELRHAQKAVGKKKKHPDDSSSRSRRDLPTPTTEGLSELRLLYGVTGRRSKLFKTAVWSDACRGLTAILAARPKKLAARIRRRHRGTDVSEGLSEAGRP